MWLAAVLILSASNRSVVLDAVGDVMLARWVGRRIERDGTKAVFARVDREFKRADMVIGNLECALTTVNYALHKPILLAAKPATLPALKRAGFAALSLANNHAGDCGPSGVEESRTLLASAKIAAIGPGLQTAIIATRGIKIGLIGLMDLPPARLDLDGQWRKTVGDLRAKSDVVVAILHWGIEGLSQESEKQRALAKNLADLGVDLIVGSHPHVLQPIRWLPGPGHRRCLVAYSLGNFVFDARPGKERVSEILSVRLGHSGVEGFRTIPVRIVRGFPELGSK